MTSGSDAIVYGARLELCGVAVRVVVVEARCLADAAACRFLVQLFQAHAAETVVLMAQDAWAIPTYFGPDEIVRILARMPFEAIPWRRYRFRGRPREVWRLPLPAPVEPPFTGTDLPTEPGTVDGRRLAPTVAA
ncbi:MAG: hypothetical protein KF773_07580 [Deltaproteobacteria bacterium]|nr:hypothetical protein [Deltaproteobacteria bacterium]